MNTFLAFPQELKEMTTLVVHRSEAEKYAEFGCPMILMDEIGAPKFRQAAVDELSSQYDRLFFFDDDLRFCRRVDDWAFRTNAKLQQATPDDIAAAMVLMNQAMDERAMVGLGARGFNQELQDRHWRYNYRQMRSFGVRTDILQHEGIRFDKYPFWEDFHVTLSLLRRGYPNAVSNWYVTDTSETNAAGGVSVYRTEAALRECREAFLQEHGAFCEAVDKSAAGWRQWDGATAPDLRVNWRKAWEERDLCER
jgi:hypothetical protein